MPDKLAHDLPGAYGEEQRVTYVIAEPCIDVLDRACVEECPVDCIYEGERALYIQPDECVDCGACEPVCPVEAIFYEDDVPGQWADFTPDNARFFAEPLAGRPGPLNSPGERPRSAGWARIPPWSPATHPAPEPGRGRCECCPPAPERSAGMADHVTRVHHVGRAADRRAAHLRWSAPGVGDRRLHRPARPGRAGPHGSAAGPPLPGDTWSTRWVGTGGAPRCASTPGRGYW